MRVICIAAFFAACLQITLQQNIETRSVGVVKPSGNGFQYGASIAITRTSQTQILFVGAPNYGSSPDGALFRCDVSSAHTSEVTTCNNRVPTDKTGSQGFSLDRIANNQKVVTCAPKYTYQCPYGTEDPWMLGACYTADATAVELVNPYQENSLCSSSFSVDIMFVVDESGSVGEDNFKTGLNWINKVLSGFRTSIDAGDVRVGMVEYSGSARLSIRLKKRSATSLNDSVTNVHFGGGTTATHRGIDKAVTEFESAQNTTKIPRLMIVMTDGTSDDAHKTTKSANAARAADITMISVGIGFGIDEDELLDIAGQKENVLEVSNFDALDEILNKLTKVIVQTASSQLEGSVNNSTSEFTNAQFGFSVHSSQGGSIMMGAVGSYDRAGSFSLFDSFDSSSPKLLNLTGLERIMSPENITQLRDTYLGYSIASGRFFGGSDEYIVSGSPRYHSKGQVVILQSTEIQYPSSNFTTLHPHGKMWQLGGYFGHSVLCLDVNGDSYDDLLVSAPLYSGQISFDQGRVFLYINDPYNPGPQQWKSSSHNFTLLRGSNANRARFGLSMAIAGDVDRNGYSDVIIGAPGEAMTSSSSGAVYVYYASVVGLSDRYKQRIEGSSVAPSLVNFGYAIGKVPRGGADVDNNQYPDVVVGAPSSDTVIVLRSRPIVNITANVSLYPANIDVIRCLNDVTSACAKFVTCVQGVERVGGANSSFDMVTKISLDSIYAYTRISLLGGDTTDTSQLVTSTRYCRTYNVTLNVAAFQRKESLYAPIRVSYSYDFSSQHKNQNLSAILDPLSPNVAHADWSLVNGCSGNNGTCISDLNLKVDYTIPASNQPYVIQSGEEVLTVTVTIGNQGPDHVFLTKLEVLSALEISQVKSSCAVLSSSESMRGKSVLVLKSAASVLFNGEECKAELRYSFQSLARAASIDKLTVQGQIYSGQNQTNDPDQSNNKFLYNRNLKYDVNLDVTSQTSGNVFLFNYSTSRPVIHSIQDPTFQIPLKHRFTIYNRGLNMLSSAFFTFQWMDQTKTNFQLLYLYDFFCFPPTKCVCKLENKVNKLGIPLNNDTAFNHSLRFPKPSEVAFPLKPTCNDVICETIRCHVTNLTVFTSLNIEASFVVWIPSLATPNFKSFLSSSVLVDTTKSPVSPTVGYNSQASTSVQAYQPPESVVSQQNGSNIGAIIGGVIAAIAFLSILILVLWKTGFFESKYKGKIEEAKAFANDQQVEEIPQSNVNPSYLPTDSDNSS